MNSDAIKDKAVEMVVAFLEGYKIAAIGGAVYKFKPGTSDSGSTIMLTSTAAQCRDYLGSIGIVMERVDSGGFPEWNFRRA